MSNRPEPDPGAHSIAERHDVLLDAALELAGEHDLDAVLTRTVARATQVAAATYAALGLYDDNGSITKFLYDGLDGATAAAIGHHPIGRGLLGETIASDGATRVDDIGADERSVGFPPHHPSMRSFLGVPVRASGRRHGNLYVTDKANGTSFDETDERLLGALATLAACAIDNSLLIQANRDRHQADEGLKAAEALGMLRQEVLAQVIGAQEAERARVARDLHDQIGQSLTSLLLALRTLDNAVPGSTEARQRAEELRELVTDTLDEVRRLAFDLRPTVLDDIGLVAAIQRLTETFHARLGMAVTTDLGDLDDSKRLPRDTETVIYRIVQEALTNVARHSGAKTASIRFVTSASIVSVEVHDDGHGFDPRLPRESLGLAGMAERAALVSGTFSIDSSPGAGTTVRLVVPRG